FAGLARLHLVLDRLLRALDQLAGAALALDLLLRRGREVVGLDGQLPLERALAEDADTIARAVGQAALGQGLTVHRVAVLEVLVQVAHIDDEVILVPRRMAEAALRHTAEQGHLAAFEVEGRMARTGAGVLALVAARGGLAHAAADATADALLALA